MPPNFRLFAISHEDADVEIQGTSMTLDEGNLVIIGDNQEPAAFFAQGKWYSCVEKKYIYDEDEEVQKVFF